MPPSKSAWKAPLQFKRNNESSYPGLQKQPMSPENGLKSQYTDTQQDEIIALSAIYGDDFIEHKAANTVWQRSEPSFDIRIKALSDEDVVCALGVVFTATYPKSAPLLSLKDDGHLAESTLFKVQKFIETKPKALAAQGQTEPMIHEIASGIQDILEDAAQAKAQGLVLPSLADEQAAHEAELAKQAEQQQAEVERKKQEATEEEERVMQNMIQEELKRQRTKEKESRKRNKPLSMGMQYSEDSQESYISRVLFDQPCKIIDSAGNDAFFTTVTGKTEYRQGLVSTTYTVRPILMNSQDCPNLALKESEVRFDPKEPAQFKKQLVSLENKLTLVKKLSHRNILELLDFRIDRDPRDNESSSPNRIVRVLTPLADKGPLDELLDLSGQLAISKVRSWTIDLLAALGYLHGQGLVHEDIHPGNILLFREGSGHVVPKLADATYQRELHAVCRKSRTASSLNTARSAYWLPPEVANNSGPVNQKTDIWDFGVVFLQMIFGLDVFEKYQSPIALMDTLSLSNPLHELVSKFFKPDAGRRPRALDLRSSEFLATDAPVIVDNDNITALSSCQNMASLPRSFRRRLDSSNLLQASSFSRFRNEFYEEGRLGKGGFGEVVKVRKKIDGQIYAIKKITQRASKSLTTILKEVLTLSQLSHPAIVRYYDAWIEQVPDMTDTEGDASTEGIHTEEPLSGSEDAAVQFATSTGGLDFMSSAKLGVEFGYGESDEDDEDDTDTDTDEEEDVDEDEEDDDNEVDSEFQSTDGPTMTQRMPTTPKRMRSHQQPFRNVLYILMEYCEKRTLRDLISQNLCEDSQEIWRLFREILDGLVHIHGLNNLVHRDLKPENIFISRGADGIPHVKIGDFGLATSGQITTTTMNDAMTTPDANEMSNVGTATYLAPEFERAGHIEDARKVDMYALGIIFFEMSYVPMLGHERFNVLKDLRGKPPRLPADFDPPDKMQTEIILSLITHNPKERPSSSELLRSGKLPMLMESESIQRALAEISDPSSPHYSKLVSAMFSTPLDRSKDYAWDMSAPNPSPTELMYQGVVKDELVSIFRCHGAVEANRNPLYPRSSHYTQNVVELLDRNGGVVQLPYDLMLGHARVLAKHTGSSFVPKSYTFGNIYRDRQNGGQPLMFGEVGFDIVSADTLDLALKEAEVIKVLDEIVDAFPSLSQMCFHIGHSDLLQLIFDFCDVDVSKRQAAAEILSKLNIHQWTWQKIRAELKLLGVLENNLFELERFDFRDLPLKAFSKLKALFEGSNKYEKAQSTIAHLKEVIALTKRMGVHSKIYINPLSSFREDFFIGGILFQCIYDKKHRDVFAAGGRYDNLIREHRPKTGNQANQRYAVGFSLSWEKLARIPKTTGKAFLKKAEEPHGIFDAKRISPSREDVECDVLVASFDTGTLRTTGVEVLQTLWAHDISAELARDSRSQEELVTRNRDESYSWIVIIKEGILKIKSMGRRDVADVEVSSTQLVSWLRAELRERDRHLSLRQADANSSIAALEKGEIPANPEQDVRVLVGNTKSKKFNRRIVVEQAQANAAALLQNFRDGPIVAVEASDAVLDLIDETALSDAESWRKAEQSVNMSERKYMREIHDMLSTWRNNWQTKSGSRHAFVYNFRTTKCVYYDLSA